MKRLLIVLAMICSLLAGAVSAQAGGAYVGIKGGLTLSNLGSISETDYTNGSAIAYDLMNLSSKDDNLVAVGACVGYDIDSFILPLRVELEYMYRTSADLKKRYAANRNYDSKLNSHTLMVNAYWDIIDLGIVAPYVGVGAGYAMHRSDAKIETDAGATVGNSGSKTTYSFAWHVGGGVDIRVLPSLSLDLGYRYLNMGKAEWNVAPPAQNFDTKADVSAHEVLLGIKYHF